MTTKAQHDKQALKALLAKINRHKNVIAKERDELRSAYEEVETLLESWDRGVERIESGLRDISDGIEAISERV